MLSPTKTVLKRLSFSNPSLLLCAFSLICTISLNSSAQEQTLKFRGLYEDIPIGEIDGIELSINIAFPQQRSTEPRPVLILIHGGGFLRGDKSLNNKRIQKMTELGFVSASVMYRFAPEHRFPAALEDTKLAIRFLKAHAAEYQLDPEQIIVSGSSSGSYLAVMAGVTGNSDAFSDHGYYPEVDSSVHAVLGQSSPIADFRLAKYSDRPTVNRLIDPNSDNREEILAAMSPITYLDPNDPPFFLSHGDADPIVPVDMSREFVEALEQQGHSYEYHEVKGGTHSFGDSAPKQASAVFDSYLKFVRKWAK